MPRAMRRRSASAPLTPVWAASSSSRSVVVGGLLLGHAQVHRHGGEPDLSAVVQVTLDPAERRGGVLDRDRPGPLQLADPAGAEQEAHHPRVEPRRCRAPATRRRPRTPPRPGPRSRCRARCSIVQCPSGTGATAFSGPIFVPAGWLRNNSQTSGYTASAIPIATATTAYPSASASGSLIPVYPTARQPSRSRSRRSSRPSSPAPGRNGAGAPTRSPVAIRCTRRCSPPSRAGDAERGHDQRQADDRADDRDRDDQCGQQHDRDRGEPDHAGDRADRAEPQVPAGPAAERGTEQRRRRPPDAVHAGRSSSVRHPGGPAPRRPPPARPPRTGTASRGRRRPSASPRPASPRSGSSPR